MFFRAGEVVNAGQPVLSLLPPQNLRLRFYVPEPVLATFALGQTVAVACDSCPAGIEAKVSFISREAEYTPPVIFSEQERAKLVFRDRGAAGRGDEPADRAAGQRQAAAGRAPVTDLPATAPSTPAAAAAPEIVIEVEGLTKSFNGRTVVKGLTMQVRKGLIYGFLGPNGCGKTTTIRMLCGLLTPDSGRGTCLGYDILTQSAAIKRHVGYMTQRFSLYADLSIRENLEFVARVYGLAKPRAAARAAIERLGLGNRADQLAGELSGGWKQRLALGACILPSPQLLLLDEPTAGVDPKARRDFWDEIHALAHEGLTVLVSTHYMDEAERCHEIAYIAYGELLAQGTVDGSGRERASCHLHGDRRRSRWARRAP